MQKIGIGYEFFKEFLDKDLYYVDKTPLIADILEKGSKVTLITRPRRFGKTLALTMLRTFFEAEYDESGNVVDNRRYFEGKKIMEAGEEILSQMGAYPVINLSLKSAKQPDFVTAFIALREEIIDEYHKHNYLLKSDRLDEEDREKIRDVLQMEKEWRAWDRVGRSSEEREEQARNESGRFATALKPLSQALKKHHGKGVIILLDEYDVPLENAYYNGFYDEMVGFIRSLFESALKTNDALERAVITGCLRISKESIFTGLNNLKVNSMVDADFAEGFGFTPEETEAMLAAYGLSDKVEEVRKWYDGYLFGESEVYNPWSVTSYVDGKVNGKRRFPRPYWSNTSSNSIIRDLVEKADATMKEELGRLIEGGTIEKQIHEDITYDDIYASEDNLWNFLFFTGYMRKVSEREEGNSTYLTMRIPNNEISYIYENQIQRWFEKTIKKEDRSVLYKAILEKDCEKIGDFVTGLLGKSISTFDSRESFYQGFFLSLLYDMPNYSARSNREEGIGRPDIVLYPNHPTDPAYIFELKARKKFNEIQGGLDEAFAQIEDRKYEDGILEDGYAGVISFALCFCKKSCVAGIK